MAKSILVGIPKSLKRGDHRVSIPPHCIERLVLAVDGNFSPLDILVEKGAGLGAGYNDAEYTDAGARIVSLITMLETAEVLVDVKQRPREGLLSNGVNIFFAHVEKGQGPDQLRALLERGGVTAYSPETFVDNGCARPLRWGSFAYAGIGGVQLLFEGIRLSYELRGLSCVPFDFFPQVDGAQPDDITDAYGRISDRERRLRFAIIGGRNGPVSYGCRQEFQRAGLSYDLLYRDVTADQDRLAAEIAQYEGIVNASSWEPGDPRIITRRQLLAMKDGAVLVDVTCDQDESSTDLDEGNPVVGGVRYSYETHWGDDNVFYWVDPEFNTFNERDPRQYIPGNVRVLYNTIGMIPGGTSIAMGASEAYFDLILPCLTDVVVALANGGRLPDNGLIVKDGRIHHMGLRELVQMQEGLAEFREYL